MESKYSYTVFHFVTFIIFGCFKELNNIYVNIFKILNRLNGNNKKLLEMSSSIIIESFALLLEAKYECKVVLPLKWDKVLASSLKPVS